MVCWLVVLRGRVIDAVFYGPHCDADCVRSSLIQHDGLDPEIEVRKES